MSRFGEADLSKLTITSIYQRATRVEVTEFAKPGDPAHARALLDELPRFLGANVLREVVDAVVRSYQAKRPVVVLLGAHVVKVGVAPYLVRLIEKGVIRHVAM